MNLGSFILWNGGSTTLHVYATFLIYIYANQIKLKVNFTELSVLTIPNPKLHTAI